jgi:hypothetical protein
MVGLVALVISVAAFVQARRVAKRESYVVAREILSDLTKGEVARARDVIGTLRYGTEKGWSALDYSDVINQYYILEWALERASYGLKGLRPAGHKVQASMITAITWHIRELTTSLAMLHSAFPRSMVDDDTWEVLESVLQLVKVEKPTPSETDVATIRLRLESLRG